MKKYIQLKELEDGDLFNDLGHLYQRLKHSEHPYETVYCKVLGLIKDGKVKFFDEPYFEYVIETINVLKVEIEAKFCG